MMMVVFLGDLWSVQLLIGLPSHEIETLVENAIRRNITKLIGENDNTAITYILDHHHIIPAAEVVRTCVERVTVGLNTVTLSIRSNGFEKLVKKYLNLDIAGSKENFRIDMHFTVAKARRGAIVIEPEGPKDIFDLPPDKLKKLVQGVIWRDEHFDGKTLTEIAKREGCSDAHVGKSIMYSFDILQSS